MLIVVIAVLLFLAFSGPAHETCTSTATPRANLERFYKRLRPGEVGCLAGGSYFVGNLRIDRGGRPGNPITLRSAPGQRASIYGRLYVTHRAKDVRIEYLTLVDYHTTLPSPTVDGIRIDFLHDNVTNNHANGVCFALGNFQYGRAEQVTIAYSNINDCGSLPPDNHQHGMYIGDAYGTSIEYNRIFDNANRGIQLYPAAEHTTIVHNLIWGNGEGIIFSGDGPESSNWNVVEHNLIVESRVRHDVESFYPSGTVVGVGNVARSNCVMDIAAGVGFTASSNVIVHRSELVHEAAGPRPRRGSACAAVAP